MINLSTYKYLFDGHQLSQLKTFDIQRVSFNSPLNSQECESTNEFSLPNILIILLFVQI